MQFAQCRAGEAAGHFDLLNTAMPHVAEALPQVCSIHAEITCPQGRQEIVPQLLLDILHCSTSRDVTALPYMLLSAQKSHACQVPPSTALVIRVKNRTILRGV